MKCGVGDYTCSLAEALGTQPGTTVGVLTDEKASSTTSRHVHDIVSIVDGWTFFEIPKIVNAIRAWRPDIVHIQFPTRGYFNKRLPFYLPMLARLTGARVVQTWHEYHLRRSNAVLLNGYLSNGIVVVRPDYREKMSPSYRQLERGRAIVFIPSASTISPVRLSDEERSAIRSKFDQSGKRLFLYFGFAFPHKGIDLLFDIADARRDYLVLACDLDHDDPYHRSILDCIRQPEWSHSSKNTGFLPAEELAALITAVDAVVLPFREGGGIWNSSIHSVAAQGTFLLTTSRTLHGYDQASNIYYAAPDGTSEMRQALDRYGGCRRSPASPEAEWQKIAEAHLQLYRQILNISSEAIQG